MNNNLNAAWQREYLYKYTLIITIVLTGFAFITNMINISKTGSLSRIESVLLFSSPWIISIVLELGLLLMGITNQEFRTILWIEQLSDHLSRIGKFNLVIIAFIISGFCYGILGQNSPINDSFSTRLLFLWLSGLVTSLFLSANFRSSGKKGIAYISLLGISLILFGIGYKIAFFFQSISAYPFTLSWSETSRYYYASLFMAKDIYGIAIPPTVLHPSRYLMQAIPFYFPVSPLWFHRTWQVFLYLGTAFATSWLLVRRLSRNINLQYRLTILWLSFFILLGPIYYHLLVSVMIIYWGYNNPSLNNKFFRVIVTWGSIILASAWAGISRLNWFPVPGLLAATIYFLETPVINQTNGLGIKNIKASIISNYHYLKPAFFFTLLGTLTAFTSQAIYIFVSGNQSKQFASSFSSDLIWHRLFPNPTYPPGILPATIIISMPLVLIIFVNLIQIMDDKSNHKSFHPIRILGMILILVVLLIGGLIVSVKIGGGSNLHNLDAYWITLITFSFYFFFNKTIPDTKMVESVATKKRIIQYFGKIINQRQKEPNKINESRYNIIRFAVGSIIIITTVLTISTGSRTTKLPSLNEINNGLDTINEFTYYATKKGKEVLFISNRHLITFNYLENVPLVPEYERVFLMEMAMAKNEEYLQRFHDDLANHRFAIIISEPLTKKYKETDSAFSAENNAWIQEVSKYILCYYKPYKTIQSTRIQILVPEMQTKNCK